MYQEEAGRVQLKPADGQELLASGRIGVYAQQGKYQLYVATLQPIGKGALELAYQQLRARLEAEGLFASERKLPLPKFPLNIALVTSRETAALQDMLKVLRRYPWPTSSPIITRTRRPRPRRWRCTIGAVCAMRST